MKKFLVILIALVCVFAVAFTACNNTGDNSGTANNEQNINGSQTDDEHSGDEQPDIEQPDNKESNGEKPYVEQPDNGQLNYKEPEKIKSYAIGDKLPDFTVDTFESSYKEGTYSSMSSEGKVLVINFWFKSCSPCTGELPYFEQVNLAYGDKVEMVAIHANNAEQPMVQSFINSKGWSNWKMIFGKDFGANETYNKFAVSKGSYPVTIVVNPDGYITYTGVGTLKIDMLRCAIDKALGN